MLQQPFFIWDDRKLVKIDLAEIHVLQTEGNYLRFYALEYSIQIRASLDKALSQIPQNFFIRVHKCYAVNVNHIMSVDRDEVKVGDVSVCVPVSRGYYNKIMSQLNIIGGVPSTRTAKRKNGTPVRTV